MNTRFLETLVVLSRLKSFRETAQVLHTTQAAASQRIAALEDELGVFLVDRSHRTLTLTPVGEQVVRQAERMLALERELKRATQPHAPPPRPAPTAPCPSRRSASRWCGRPSACWRWNASSSARRNPMRRPPGACASA